MPEIIQRKKKTRPICNPHFDYLNKIDPEADKVKRRYYDCPRGKDCLYPKGVDFYYVFTGAYQPEENWLWCFKELCSAPDTCKKTFNKKGLYGVYK